MSKEQQELSQYIAFVKRQGTINKAQLQKRFSLGSVRAENIFQQLLALNLNLNLVIPQTGGCSWKFVNELTDYYHYTSDWLCSDGDHAELYISRDIDSIRLECFSGVPYVTSQVSLDSIDWQPFIEKIDPQLLAKLPDVEADRIGWSFGVCFHIADYFCSLFCNENIAWDTIECAISPVRYQKQAKDFVAQLPNHPRSSEELEALLISFVNLAAKTKLWSHAEVLKIVEDYDREFKLDTMAYTKASSLTVKEWLYRKLGIYCPACGRELSNDVCECGWSRTSPEKEIKEFKTQEEQ